MGRRNLRKSVLPQCPKPLFHGFLYSKAAVKPSQTDSESNIPFCNLTRATRSAPLRFLQASLEVIGATNRHDAVNQALRRPGCFDREIALGVPNKNARAEILSVLTHNLRIESTFYRFKIARFTPGFVGADFVALRIKHPEDYELPCIPFI
ncbi:hypothetical protein IEQ34_014677 [Dendrobium chrysotoxum]|uniref:Uncharacterized protein n=1 Tax=Dendrobium chrysotoxum TaxID=161865 RepID=A0AAV7GMF3_DENCH|nr:hypothetical protein IEQ34_014677 [Dendrobium chrysotoxum]